MTVWRYTYGFNRRDHDLSVEFIAQATDMHVVGVKREIKNLIKQNVIIVTKQASGVSPRRIAFNKKYVEWCKSVEGADQLPLAPENEIGGTDLLPLEGTDSLPLVGVNSLPKKDKRKKDNIYTRIISYLNEKAGKRFNPKVQNTQKLINGRISEGRTYEDFVHVIDVKCNEWLDNPKMFPYLKPDTLFSGKNFDKYLNQPVVQQEESQQAAGYDMAYEDALREWVVSGNDPELFRHQS